MAIFNSYFDITRGYIPLNPIKSHEKPPFSYGFPMVFLWFSYDFQRNKLFPIAESPSKLGPYKKKQRNVATVLGRNVVIIVITIPIIKYIYT